MRVQNLIRSAFLSSAAAMSSMSSAQADIASCASNIHLSAVTASVATKHFKSETPIGNKYNEFNPGALFHFDCNDSSRYSMFGGAILNSVKERATMVGVNIELGKTQRFGGLSTSAMVGGLLSGYDKYQAKFEKKTGSPIPPFAALKFQFDKLKIGRVNTDILFIPPSAHSPAVGLSFTYKIR